MIVNGKDININFRKAEEIQKKNESNKRASRKLKSGS